MSEPTEAAYEAVIRLLSQKADITSGGPLDAAWVVPTDLVRLLVAVVWPIAVSEGRRQAADDIRAEHDRIRPVDQRPFDGLVGMATRDAARVAEKPLATGGPVKPGQVYSVGQKPAPTCPVCGHIITGSEGQPFNQVATSAGYMAWTAVATKYEPCGHIERRRLDA